MNVRHIYLMRITSRRVRARCYSLNTVIPALIALLTGSSSLVVNESAGRQHDQLSLGAGLTKTSKGSRHPLLPHLYLLCITCTERTSRIFNEAQKLPNMEVLSTHL